MTLLRPRTAAAIRSWPEEPVVYHRPVLRTVSALLLLGWAVFDVSMVWFPPEDDPLLASDWWLGLAVLSMVGSLHLLTSSKMRVTRTHVELHNPFRRVAIPIGQITGVTPGANLRVETSYGRFYAWGVEAANVQSASDTYGAQGELQVLIETAAARATSVERLQARYRFNRPYLWLLFVSAVITIDAVKWALTGPGA